MMRTIKYLLIIAMLIAVIPAGAKRLPDEALKRAQQAEKELKANKPLEALKILVELDRQHPKNPALNLRIAQVYDGMNQPGSALLYYRRYAKVAGDRPVDEAVARLQTLERLAGVPEETKKLAAKLGEPTEPYSGPAADVSHSILASKEDGSLVELKGEEDLKRINDLKPFERRSAAMGYAVPDMDEEAEAVATEDSDAQSAGDDEPEAIEEDVETPGPRHNTKTIPSTELEEDVPSLSGNSPAAAATPRAATSQKLNVSVGAGGSNAQQLAAAMKPATAKKQRPFAPPSKGAPAADDGFFRMTKTDSLGAVLDLNNELPGSMLTFSAIPAEGGKSVNVILAGGERRKTDIAPGKYEVSIQHTDSSYPPVNVLERKFERTFLKGRQYSRTFTGQPEL